MAGYFQGTTDMARVLKAAVMGAALVAGGVGAATAAPDLVIVEEDSVINFESCEENRPLATGLIAIKNIGDSRAKMRLGLLTRFSRSMLAVYVPEHLDMIDNGFERSVMDARDQESIRIEVAKGVKKRGRFPTDGYGYAGTSGSTYSGSTFGSSSGSSYGSNSYGGATTVDLDPNSIVLTDRLQPDDRKEMQRALRDLGYYTGPIDGVFGAGVQDAIRSFQRSFGLADGRLTVAQVEELSKQTGRSLAISDTQPSGRSGDLFAGGSSSSTSSGGTALARQSLNRAGGGRVEITLYAVVDPYNLVEESDETNNLVKFTGVIDCN